MLSLTELAATLGGELRNSDGTEQVSGVSYDSRKVKHGDIFVAISGNKDDGYKYIEAALDLGAVAVIVDRGAGKVADAPAIEVKDSRAALACATWAVAGNPQKQLKLIGVTGTNGKTTVATALAQLLTLCGKPAGACGTLGMFYDSYQFDSDRTTAEAPELAQAFHGMLERGAQYVAVEATSIGLAMHRLDGLQFDVAVFTNLSRDHLDFHGSWEAYRQAKLTLFESSRLAGTAVVNSDDPESGFFLKHTTRPVVKFGIDEYGDFLATELELRADGTRFSLLHKEGRFEVQTSLIGRFNVYNTLAIIASANALGLSLNDIITALPKVKSVRGRAEVVSSSAQFTVLVDYAHTPDALEKILSTVRDLTDGSLHCVVGAGGDRDKGKRPLMAKAAAKWSNRVYLTSDNPRSENPQTILDDMVPGAANHEGLYSNVDRRTAIQDALASAKAGDVVVVAGKGHETYQEIHGVKHPFDDAEVIRDWLRSAGFLE